MTLRPLVALSSIWLSKRGMRGAGLIGFIFLVLAEAPAFGGAKPKMPSVWFSGRVAVVGQDPRELEVQRMDSPIAMNFQVPTEIEIYRHGREMRYDELKPGDIVTVFYEGQGRATHIEVFPPKRSSSKPSASGG